MILLFTIPWVLSIPIAVYTLLVIFMAWLINKVGQQEKKQKDSDIRKW